MMVTVTYLAHFDLPAWSARIYGIQSKSKTVLLRNHKWPGAYAVFQQGTFYNVYIGNGQKDFVVDRSISISNQMEEVCRDEEQDPEPEIERIELAQQQAEETLDE
eukprot:NODE_38_length_30618_cov_0.377142.p21 type:complete len:105 gc:universal NODE_38_length_30618_cov_0.377142:7116-7430(+)